MKLERRSLTSVSWSFAANSFLLILLFIRSVLLARWLPVDVFGIFTVAYSVILIAAVIPNWGMAGAFLHRDETVKDEGQAAAVHFTLKIILTMLWTAGMFIFAFLVPSTASTIALVVLIITTSISHLIQTPNLILSRRVVFRRIALIDTSYAFLSLIVAVIIAQLSLMLNDQRLALWALLSAPVVKVSLQVFFYYIWRPVWRPKVAWDSATVRYFLAFGSKNFVSVLLLRLLDRIDDLWTGIYLGAESLGFYSRAYRFATYPREVIARPVNQVMPGAYAELKEDRDGLSKAFIRSNVFLIRAGFLAGGTLTLIAPEFISIALTDKWMPMLTTFRLMLIFTLLDPLKVTVTSMMVSVGAVTRPIPVRLIQLLILVLGMFLLGPRWGIEGVALAVNIMAFMGVTILFLQARTLVDFSIRKLFLVPTVALTIGLVLGGAVLFIPGVIGSDLRSGLVKATVFFLTYSAVLLIFESKQTIMMAKPLRHLGIEKSLVS
jgi:O-antigen/teichoic acid export membrane protein